MRRERAASGAAAGIVFAVLSAAVGCHTSLAPMGACGFPSDVPRELQMASLPIYRVAPPDILLIEAVNNIRTPGTHLRAGDTVVVRLANPEPLEPVKPDTNPVEAQLSAELDALFKTVNGPYLVQPNGRIDLGPIYGSVPVAGLTAEQAQRAIEQHLRSYTTAPGGARVGLTNPKVSVTWPDIAGRQAITGEHLVRLDGTVSLGIYGSVYVAGMTLAEVKSAVERHLSTYVHEPEVSVDVVAYNSRVCYIVMDGGGYGEQVVKLPITGNETVLDAIATVEGLSQVSSKRIWIARPAPAGTGCAQVMAVNWHEITAEGITDTNYQVLPGDRIYVKADHLIAFDNFIAKVTSPFERIFGFTLLGTGTVRAIKFFDAPPGGGGNAGTAGSF